MPEPRIKILIFTGSKKPKTTLVKTLLEDLTGYYNPHYKFIKLK